ncbi:unnamed protein product [Sphenostylis stenocarpa]|uniref:Uncharacterized protein n=1 Tax=Sphenostylis stenocarpa TaxID=92480 RepID=A0AA86TBJ7_9FABA|nr:unnamed protein product [Sphenostylis stenocarpa]
MKKIELENGALAVLCSSKATPLYTLSRSETLIASCGDFSSIVLLLFESYLLFGLRLIAPGE